MTTELLREKRVKCISIYTEKDTGRSRNQELCFDQSGQVIRALTFWGNPVQTDSELFVYDSKGNELEYTRIVSVSNEVSATGEPIFQRTTARYTSQYDNGRLVRSEANAGAYSLSRANYSILKYDTLGYAVEEIAYDTIKGESRRTVWVNNKEGKHILQLSYDTDGEIRAFSVTTYDGLGRKTMSQLKNAGKYSNYQNEVRYFYDSNGRLIREEQYIDGAATAKVEEYQYDASGLLLRIVSPDRMESIEYTYY